MAKKLPRVVALPIKKNISHNKEVFYGTEKTLPSSESLLNEDLTQDEIYNRIEQVFHSIHHSFHIPVTIRTKDKTYHTKLIGKVDNRLLTMEDEEININDIRYFEQDK